MKEDIEERASRVLAQVPGWIWDGERLPVPVEDIADSCFGLHVRDVEDLSDAPGVPEVADGRTLSGLLLPGRGEIWVNAAEARDWPPRRRFTIGHELGHWCMHRHGTEAVWCRAPAVDPQEDRDGAAAAGGREAWPPEEHEANEFAAALLMPAELVRRHYRRLRERDPDNCFKALCSIFQASGGAMSRRLRRVV